MLLMYDLEKLSWRVDALRKKFKISATVFGIIMLIGAAMLFVKAREVQFFGGVIIAAGIILTIRLIGKYSPTVLFSADVKGISIKEHEYAAVKVARVSAGRVTRFRSGTGSNDGLAKSNRPHVRSAAVYLRLENGDVMLIDGLTSLHTDIYEIGDELLRPSGSRYPIVLSRDIEKQPCPWCGRINSMKDHACQRCGLDILKIKS